MANRTRNWIVGGLLGLASVPAAQADTSVTDPQFTFGGFVKMAALFSRYSDGAVAQGPGRDFYLPGSVPVSASPTTGKEYFDTQAKETRLFFGVKGKVDEHAVGAFVEADFISGQIPQVWNSASVSGNATAANCKSGALITGSSSNSCLTTTTTTTGNKISTNAYNPALRRAYLTYDGLLVGQDWSTFQNTDVLPETTDFIGGVDGLVFVRQPQVRYTSGGFQAALESSDTTVSGSGIALAPTNDNTVPDLVLRYNVAGSAGSFSAAVMARQLRDSGTVGTISGGATATTTGEGISLAGKIALWPKADLRFMLSSGRGIGRYIGLDTVGDALLDTGKGELVAIPVTAGFLALHVPLCPQWTGNLILSQESANLKDRLAGAGSTTQSQSAAINAFYSPIKSLSFGTELRYARRNALASAGSATGLIGSMDRVEFSAKYAF